MAEETIQHVATVFPIRSEALKDEKYLFSRRRSILREFSLNTSTHGIPGIARSRSVPNRVFWSVSLVIYTSIMLYFIIQSIRQYFQYPTQTSVSIDLEWPQNFPAVTICNYSPLRYDLFSDPFLAYIRAEHPTRVNASDRFSPEHANLIRDFFQYKLNRGESLLDYFYSLESMLISCVYNSLNCSEKDFIAFLSPHFGLCYTLNAKTDQIRNGTLYTNTDNGQPGSLELRLYVHSHQYVPYFSDAVGLMSMIHDNQVMPLVSSGGYYLGAGRKHRLIYSKKINSVLAAPYSTCDDRTPFMLKAVYERITKIDYAYQEEMCYAVCSQIYTYDQCGCVNPLQWYARAIVLPGTTTIIDAPICNITDRCYTRASKRFRVDTSIWESYCSECTRECVVVIFRERLSSFSAPPDWMMDEIKTFVEASSVPRAQNWSTQWPSEIAKNYVALNVECEGATVENLSQRPSVTGLDVLSSVGGQSGLWIGLSFLSLMEIVEMLFRLARHHYRLVREKLRRRM